MADKKTTQKETEIEQAVPEGEKYVRIILPRAKKDEEDEVVWVNERRFLIKKGVPVDVPESVAEILENKYRMLQYSYDFEDKVQKEQD